MRYPSGAIYERQWYQNRRHGIHPVADSKGSEAPSLTPEEVKVLLELRNSKQEVKRLEREIV